MAGTSMEDRDKLDEGGGTVKAGASRYIGLGRKLAVLPGSARKCAV